MAFSSRPSRLRLALLAVASSAATGAAEPLGITSLDGRELSALVTAPTASIRVYAFPDSGDPRPIPFQIDERDHRGRWIVDHGRKAGADDTPGKIDDNDALTVMNRDLGRRGDVARLPPAAQRWTEIGIGEGKSALGWIYVATFPAAPPPLASDPGYVRYEPDTDRVLAARYALAFGGPLPRHIAFVERLGDFGTNLLGAVRASGEARLFGGLVNIRRDETAIESDLEGYRVGPIRVIRRAQYWLRLPLGFKARGRVALLFHRDAVAAEAVARIEIPPSLLPGDGELTATFDFRDLEGARLLLDGASTAAVVDGSMSKYESEVSGRAMHAAALGLPDGDAFLLTVDLRGALRRLDQRLRYIDDAGRRPSFGFELSRVNRLETGEHPMTVTGMVLDDSSRTAEATTLLLEAPARSIRIVERGTAQPTARSKASSMPSSSANKKSDPAVF